MAVSSEAVEFDDFHFDANAFNALLRANGTRALLRFATICGCHKADTGTRDASCTLCYPTGWILDAEEEVWVHGPSRKPARQFTEQGVVDTGEVFFTLPSTKQAPVGSHIILPDAVERVSDLLTKGSEDMIRFAHIERVERAHRIVRTPPTGSPYTNELVTLEEGVDFTIEDGRRIVWPSNSPVPNGARYAVRLLVQSEYVVWEVQSRVENGVAMPYRYACKRYDSLLHPRGEGELSF